MAESRTVRARRWARHRHRFRGCMWWSPGPYSLSARLKAAAHDGHRCLPYARVHTATEVAAHVPPTCPTCGKPIRIDWIDVSSMRDLADGERVFLPGDARCPTPTCDPLGLTPAQRELSDMAEVIAAFAKPATDAAWLCQGCGQPTSPLVACSCGWMVARSAPANQPMDAKITHRPHSNT